MFLVLFCLIWIHTKNVFLAEEEEGNLKRPLIYSHSQIHFLSGQWISVRDKRFISEEGQRAKRAELCLWLCISSCDVVKKTEIKLIRCAKGAGPDPRFVCIISPFER